MPYVFVLLILRHGTPRWVYVLTGFVTGLCIDAVSTTPGVAAGALTFAGLLTPGVLQFFASRRQVGRSLSAGRAHDDVERLFEIRGHAFVRDGVGISRMESFSFFHPAALGLNIGGSFCAHAAFLSPPLNAYAWPSAPARPQRAE